MVLFSPIKKTRTRAGLIYGVSNSCTQSQLLPQTPINTFPSSETGCHHPDHFFPANASVPPDIFQAPLSAPGSIVHSSLQLPSFDLRAHTPTPLVFPSGVVMKYPPHLPAVLLIELSLVAILWATK